MAAENREQQEFWNETAGPKWVRMQAALDLQLEPYGRAAIDAAGLGPGDAVVDVGCGCGATSVALAEAVTGSGSVLGVDVSAPMLEVARVNARGLSKLEFLEADAQDTDLGAQRFDVLFSRFGVMFFADPVKAFTNLAASLRKGGRVSFICWREPALNPWLSVPTLAAMQHVTIEPPAGPTAPGPFAFADPVRLRGILEGAGFTEVSLDPFDHITTLAGGGDAESVAKFLIELGPVMRALTDADDAVRRRVGDAVRDALLPYETADGVRMDSACWLVTARRP